MSKVAPRPLKRFKAKGHSYLDEEPRPTSTMRHCYTILCPVGEPNEEVDSAPGIGACKRYPALVEERKNRHPIAGRNFILDDLG
jgi:hypothetical protein